MNEILSESGSSPLSEGVPALDILRRPQVDWHTFSKIIKTEIPEELGERISVSLKYEGYIERQERQVEKFKKMEILKFPEGFDFASVTGLSAEGRQKLIKALPRTLGQASRISGVPPTDIQLLWVAVENKRREKSKE